MKTGESRKKVSLMVSYSHSDDKHRERLEKALSSLRRQGVIDIWSDNRILPGRDIDAEVSASIHSVDIILLLISTDFIDSDYCYEKEMEFALRRHEANECIVMPIIVRPCDWKPLPFGRLKAYPKDGVPVTEWENADSAWLDIASAVRSLVDERVLRKEREAQTNIRGSMDSLKEKFQRLAERYSDRNRASAHITTNIKGLDELLGPLSSPELMVIASRPGIGHQDLLLGICVHSAIKREASVLYLSPREPASLVMRRAISIVGNINRESLTNGDLGEDDWPKVTAAITLLSSAQFSIDESRKLSSTSLIFRLRNLAKKIKPDLIAIEGIDYYAIDDGARTEEKDTSYIAKNLKSIAKDFHIPILCGLSLKPGPEERFDKRPLISDLCSWHCLEDDADRLLFVYREYYYNPENCNKHEAEIAVIKNSYGTKGVVKSAYLEDYGKFDDIIFS